MERDWLYYQKFATDVFYYLNGKINPIQIPFFEVSNLLSKEYGINRNNRRLVIYINNILKDYDTSIVETKIINTISHELAHSTQKVDLGKYEVDPLYTSDIESQADYIADAFLIANYNQMCRDLRLNPFIYSIAYNYRNFSAIDPSCMETYVPITLEDVFINNLNIIIGDKNSDYNYSTNINDYEKVYICYRTETQTSSKTICLKLDNEMRYDRLIDLLTFADVLAEENLGFYTYIENMVLDGVNTLIFNIIIRN
jgi:hypothetical protein